MKITKLWEQKIDLLLKCDKIPLYKHPYYGIVYNNTKHKNTVFVKEDFAYMKGFFVSISLMKDYKHRIIQFYEQFEDYTIEEFTLWLKMKGY